MPATTTAALFISLLLVSAGAHAQSLDEARELYASAEYDRALALLDSLSSLDRPHEEQQSIALYRVLCLLATGKDANARTAMEELITRNPGFRPSNDLPPRVRSVYQETRRRLLPMAVQSAYQEAKTAFDGKDYATAERGFTVVLDVLSDPDLQSLASQSPLADIRTLAAGFRELSVKAAAPPPPIAVAPPSAATAARAALTTAAAAPFAVTPEQSVAPPVLQSKTYDAGDTNVVPPTALNQQLPGFPGAVRTAQTGILEVVIDTTGGVESATMVMPVNPQYDRVVVGAARSWRYQPARVDGLPVKFRKRIQVNLVPNNISNPVKGS